MCYDLDVLADLTNTIRQQFQALFTCTDQSFTDDAMRYFLQVEYLDLKVLDESTSIRLSQFEPP